MADKKKILVIDNPFEWIRTKPFLEEQLDCKIDIFDKVDLARKAMSRENGSDYSLVIIDFRKSPEKSKVANIAVDARLNFIKSELSGKYPLLIYSRTGMRALSEKYGFLLGRDYQASVFKKYGSDKKLLEEIVRLIG